MKIFDFDARTGSLVDSIKRNIPVNTSVVFRKGDKGYSAYFSSTSDLDGFGVVSGVKTIAMIIRPTTNTKLLQDNNTDRIEISSGNISGAGLTECTVNNVNTDAVSNNIWSLVIAEFSAGINFSTDLEIDVTANTDINRVICYDEILSSALKIELYQNFLKSGSISTPTVIRPKFEVDPKGTTLCYDFQRWDGKTVMDLSGNGNHGTVTGFVDKTQDGAKFHRVAEGVTTNASYIYCGTGGGITGNLTVEALVDTTSITGQEGIINKGEVTAAQINYYLALVSPSTLRFIIGNGVTFQEYIVAITEPLVGKNIHLIATVDGTNIRIYYNGVLIKTTVQTVTPTSNASSIYLGTLTSVWHKYNGTIKFIRVYPRALSQDEVKQRYNKIASTMDLQAATTNLRADGSIKTVGGSLEI